MSLTPESTADSAMNSQSKASAISRASVVLPTPGGPHRIIECGLPDSNASAAACPAQQMRWPITSSSVFGRKASASGWRGSVLNKVIHGTTGRVATARNTSGALRHHEAGTCGSGSGRIFSKFGKVSSDSLAEGVAATPSPAGTPSFRPMPMLFEGGVLRLRRRFQPFQAVLACRLLQREILFQVVAAEQDRRRRRAERIAQLPHRDLVQVLVVDVQLLAVGLQQLLVGLLVGPDEFAGPRENEGAAGGRGQPGLPLCPPVSLTWRWVNSPLAALVLATKDLNWSSARGVGHMPARLAPRRKTGPGWRAGCRFWGARFKCCPIL